MNRIGRTLFVICLCTIMTSCIGLHSISVGDVSQEGGERASGSASALGILALTVPVPDDLERKALAEAKSKGASKNFTSRLSMRNWVIVQNYKVEVVGEK